MRRISISAVIIPIRLYVLIFPILRTTFYIEHFNKFTFHGVNQLGCALRIAIDKISSGILGIGLDWLDTGWRLNSASAIIP